MRYAFKQLKHNKSRLGEVLSQGWDGLRLWIVVCDRISLPPESMGGRGAELAEGISKGSFPPFLGAVFPHFVSADISTYRKKYHARDQTVIRGEFSCPVRITTFSDIVKSA